MHFLTGITLLTSTLAAASPILTHKPRTKGSWTTHDLIGLGHRQEHAVVALDDQIYAIGGVAINEIGELNTINRVEYYRIADNSWHTAAPIPQPLNHLNVGAVGDKLYLLGALSGGVNWTAQGESYVYHPTNDSWTGVASMPNGTARGSSAVGVWEDTMYLAGGMTYLNVFSDGTQDSVAMVSSYNTSTDSWKTDYPTLPQPRQHVGGAVVDGVFYVLGGRENDIEQYHDTVYALDLADPVAWKTLAPMPTARGGLACSAVEHEIFCFGGEGNPENEGMIFDDVEVYDTRKDEWRRLNPMPVPRHGTGSATVGGRVYVPGGGLQAAAGPTGWFDSFTPGGQ